MRRLEERIHRIAPDLVTMRYSLGSRWPARTLRELLEDALSVFLIDEVEKHAGR